ncbi:UspA domain-containing protein [Natrialba hulunbeirensis JCM 10989]|uniref:UspA domain-containing protein n=1 Tax=Natrialba hulunbeirensis JCM 10989 TaxID=1227493 RepID=M0A9L0_9EURY|nr:universal stress protein [Natrialba hulunbeirensis]ELY93998.1 UspA domain-containing protein [Natrialba hulunbeirensis JCM 10989]
MPQHVLVPVDDSDRSTDALEFACQEYPDATITALHVIDPGDFYAATGIEGGAMANYEEIQKHHESRADELLESAREQADTHGVEIQTDRVVGGISRSIVNYAEENDVDHITLGSHGRTGASRILLGSVAENVARRSPVPVTIVR